MLDIFTIILAVIGTAAVAFLIHVARQPGEFRVERTAEIGAPADEMFSMINALRQFNMDKMVGGEFAKGLADLKIMADRR
jgi:hypothetical protein